MCDSGIWVKTGCRGCRGCVIIGLPVANMGGSRFYGPFFQNVLGAVL